MPSHEKEVYAIAGVCVCLCVAMSSFRQGVYAIALESGRCHLMVVGSLSAFARKRPCRVLLISNGLLGVPRCLFACDLSQPPCSRLAFACP